MDHGLGSQPEPDDPRGSRELRLLLLWSVVAVLLTGIVDSRLGLFYLDSVILAILVGVPWLWFLLRRKARMARLRVEEDSAVVRRQLDWEREVNAPPPVRKV